MSVPIIVRRLLGYPMLVAKRRLLTRFRASLPQAREVQQQMLQKILRQVEGSRFARDYGLHAVRTPEDLRQAMPVAGYERMDPYVENMLTGAEGELFSPGTRILMYAMTSGTTSKPKHIPVTPVTLAEYRESWTIWAVAISETHPVMPYGGVLNLASQWRAQFTPAGVPCGSITGLLFHNMHTILRVTNVVPPAVAEVEETTLKMYLALRLALPRRDTMMVTTANPSSLILLASRMNDWKEDLIRDIHDGTLRNGPSYSTAVFDQVRSRIRQRDPALAHWLERRVSETGGVLFPRHAWEKLTLLGVWTGGNLGSYLPRLPEYYGEIPLRDHGLSASECRMTIPLENHVPWGHLNIHGGFFEFIPEEEYGSISPRTLLAHELEPGGRYYIILTTSAGLFRYDISDVVECSGFDGTTPLLRFLNKGKHISSITGEKLTASQVAEAVTLAIGAAGLQVAEYIMAPRLGSRPGYVLFVEDEENVPPVALDTLAKDADRELMAVNMEYADKRKSGRLEAVRVISVTAGSFARLKEQRLKATGGAFEQYKHPFLMTDPEFADRFAGSNGSRREVG